MGLTSRKKRRLKASYQDAEKSVRRRPAGGGPHWPQFFGFDDRRRRAPAGRAPARRAPAPIERLFRRVLIM